MLKLLFFLNFNFGEKRIGQSSVLHRPLIDFVKIFLNLSKTYGLMVCKKRFPTIKKVNKKNEKKTNASVLNENNRERVNVKTKTAVTD